MNHDNTFLSNATEATIRIGILALLIAWCFTIIKPFLIPGIWGVIIAVASYPGFLKLRDWLGGRTTLAATLITVLGLFILITPAVLLSGTVIDGAEALAQGVQNERFAIPPPPASIKDWPLIGATLDSSWRHASQNLIATATPFTPQLKSLGVWLLSMAANLGIGLLQFSLALMIAGLLLAHADNSARAAQAIAQRLAGEKGASLARLAEATVRSVTRGILGVALIQSLLAGIGFMFIGIPGAGLWALLCLFLSVVQIGLLPVTLPIVIYVFFTADTGPAVLFMLWSILVGAMDNVLKPILLGRGVAVPMAIIFVGAIGGFLSSGIIGLFVGSVVLVLGYKLILAWLEENTKPSSQ